jgi:DNA-binding PadR family transcriptional regulator
MSAKHALLGLLLDGPTYPYQLASRLRERLGPAWEVNSGKLYQTVKGLERDGLIERAEAVGPKRDNRHVYAITGEGIAEFDRWFGQTAGAVRLCRRPLLVKITFAGPQRLRDAMAKVDAYELDCAKRLEEIAGVRDALPADGTLVRADHLLLRLNLGADILQLEAELQWASHAREMLSWLADQEALWPSHRERTNAVHTWRERHGARSELFKRRVGPDGAGAEPSVRGTGD